MGAVGRLDHAVDEQAADQQRLRRPLLGEVLGGHDPLGRQEASIGGAEEEVVHVRIGPEVLAVAAGVGAVHVHEGGVHREGRHGDQLLAVVEGRGDHPHAVVVAEDVGAEADAGGEERHPPGRRLEAEQEHALVVGLVLDGTRLASGAEVRLERDRVERHERVHEPLHLAGGAQQPDVRPAPAHDREVVDVGAQERAHDRHRLAARAPPADADGHPRAQLGDGVLLGAALVLHHVSRRVSRFSTKASRCSSATPERLSSKVKPCS